MRQSRVVVDVSLRNFTHIGHNQQRTQQKISL